MRTSPVVVLLAVTLTATGCGGESGDTGGPGAPTSGATSSPPTTSPSAPTSRTAVSVYLMHGEKLQPVRRLAEGTDVGADAVRELLEGPTSSERSGGLTSAVPAGTTLRSLSVANGLATVDLSGSYDDGGGSLSMTARVAQVVFTLTRFPTVTRVSFKLDGRPVTSLGGEGVDVSDVRRTDFEDLQPAVLVESPRWDEAVTLPLRVTGSANTFEAEFRLELKDSTGKVIADKQVMATSGSGTRGTFDTTLTGTVTAAGTGRLTAYTLSAEDGSRDDESSLPVALSR